MKNLTLLFVMLCAGNISALQSERQAQIQRQVEQSNRKHLADLQMLMYQNNHREKLAQGKALKTQFDGLQETIKLGDLPEFSNRLDKIKNNQIFKICLELSMLSASHNGKLEILEYLVDIKGANLNAIIPSEKTALFQAISQGQVNTALFIADRLGIDSIVLTEGKTAAMIAAEQGQIEVIKSLIAAGADLSIAYNNETALSLAIWKKKHDIALLIAEKLGVNTIDRAKEMTAVILAAWMGDEELLQSLMARGADFSIVSKNKSSALHAAIKSKHINAALTIAKKLGINSFDGGGRTAAQMAVDFGNEILLQALIENGANLNIFAHPNNSVLIKAIRTNQVDMVLLIVKNLGINSLDPGFGKTAAMIAATLGKEKILKSLIENGADLTTVQINPDLTPYTALKYAIKDGRLDAAMTIWQRLGVNNQEQASGMTAAMMAAQFGQMDILKTLTDWGADLRIKNKEGWSALSFAILNNRLEMVTYLLQAQGKILTNMAIAPGISPVNFAAELGRTEIMNELIAHGSNLMVMNMDAERNNCLTAAIRSRNPLTVASLLKLRVNVDIKDGFGRTPLMIATTLTDYDIFKLLLEHGACLTSKDLAGKTVSFYATNPEFKNFLTGVKKNQEVKKELAPVRTYYRHLVPNLGSEVSDLVLDYLPGMMAMIEFREVVKNEMLLKEFLAAKKIKSTKRKTHGNDLQLLTNF